MISSLEGNNNFVGKPRKVSEKVLGKKISTGEYHYWKEASRIKQEKGFAGVALFALTVKGPRNSFGEYCCGSANRQTAVYPPISQAHVKDLGVLDNLQLCIL